MNSAGLRTIAADGLEQVQGRCVCLLAVPADVPAFREMIAAAFRGEGSNLVLEVVGLNGTPRTLETHGGPLRDGPEHNDVRAFLGVTRVITQQWMAAATGHESGQRYRSPVVSVPGAVFAGQAVSPWKDTFMSEGIGCWIPE